MENKDKKSSWEQLQIVIWFLLVYFAITGGIKWYFKKIKTSYIEKNYFVLSFLIVLPLFFAYYCIINWVKY